MYRARIHLILFVLLLLSSYTIVAKRVLSEEMQELAAALHETCRDETGAPEEVLVEAQSGKFPENEKLKCYMKCLMTEMATMDDDGIVDVEATIALMPKEDRRKVAPTIRKCGTQVGANACDNAFLTFKCYYEDNEENYFLP